MRAITLLSGEQALVDNDDYERLYESTWRNVHGYAARGRTTILMHREVMRPLKNMEVDHVNNNKLDNRKVNLRICSRKENGRNRSLNRNNKSGYKGVIRHAGKWRAMIRAHDGNFHLGMFDVKEIAALAYDSAAIQLYGDYANLNLL